MNATRAAPAPATALRIAAQGACCAVGNSAPAAVAAMRAHLGHFSPSSFSDDAGRPIPAALLYQVPLNGRERLRHMYRMAVEECLSCLPLDPDAPLPPTILLGGERGAREAKRLDWLLQTSRPEDGHDKRTCRMAAGKAGIGAALRKAREIFAAPNAPEYVVIAAVDSFLEPEAIAPFIESRRILCSTNSDGFMPGEAGAAIALTPRPSGQPALWIEGVGIGTEPASPESSDPPLIGQGMTEALRAAIAEAGRPPRDYTFQAAGYSGEQWYFKEASLALTRVIDENMPVFDTRLICEAVGEVGAACGPLGLAWVGHEMSLGLLGQRGLLHLSNHHGGERAALALHYRV